MQQGHRLREPGAQRNSSEKHKNHRPHLIVDIEKKCMKYKKTELLKYKMIRDYQEGWDEVGKPGKEPATRWGVKQDFSNDWSLTYIDIYMNLLVLIQYHFNTCLI